MVLAIVLKMLLLSPSRFTKFSNYHNVTFPPDLSQALSMRVISTDPRASLPAKHGQAEILNSSLKKYPEATICARFLTYHFSTHSDSGPEQILLSSGDDVLLSSYITRPCELKFQGDLWEASH